jgi:hypothetical protein
MIENLIYILVFVCWLGMLVVPTLAFSLMHNKRSFLFSFIYFCVYLVITFLVLLDVILMFTLLIGTLLMFWLWW